MSAVITEYRMIDIAFNVDKNKYEGEKTISFSFNGSTKKMHMTISSYHEPTKTMEVPVDVLKDLKAYIEQVIDCIPEDWE